MVAQKLKIDGDIIQQKHHILENAYESLPISEQELLGTISCFRSSVSYKTLQFLHENNNSLDSDLQDLIERGLLHFDITNRSFYQHPLIRRYAYLILSPETRLEIHKKIAFYLVGFISPLDARRAASYDGIGTAVELYYHTVRAGDFENAIQIYALNLSDVIFYRLCLYSLEIDLLNMLFTDEHSLLPHLKDKNAQAWVLNSLAGSYIMVGQSKRSILLLEQNIKIRKEMRDPVNVANSLISLTQIQIQVGALGDADEKIRLAINIGKKFQNKFSEAVSHQELGRLLFHCAKWDEANEELDVAFMMFENMHRTQSLSVVSSFYAHCLLLMGRHAQVMTEYDLSLVVEFALRAIKFSNEAKQDPSLGHFERDFVRAHWLLGAAYRLGRQFELSDYHLSQEALNRCKAINLIESEASILLELAHLYYVQINYTEAKSLAEEALVITERCGYALQGADVNLFLAQYALEQENDKVKAKEYAETALKLAYCDGPPYYYKVAYDEAERMLEKLK
jgi:tetratricopeptide (TPR) repeat protein